MNYCQEDYTKHYIVTALFKLMNEYEYNDIKVTDIAKKAGVGRATFYRYFKNKDEIVVYYFEHNAREFQSNQHFYPRCKEDYVQIVCDIMTKFKENKEPLKLLKKSRLEGLYLDYLNKNFVNLFGTTYSNLSDFTPYLYAGMLFNISMKWLDDDCKESPNILAEVIVNAIYPNN